MVRVRGAGLQLEPRRLTRIGSVSLILCVGPEFSMKQFLQRHVISILIVLVLAVLAAFFVARLQEAPAGDGGGPGGAPVPVVVAEVVRAPFTDALRAVGSARANESVEITANVSDRIDRIRFEEGEMVERGQLLVEMNAAEARADLAEARANLRDDQRQLKRLEQLVATNSASRAQRDEQQARVEASEARVAALEARLDEREIRAPFAGRLGLRNVSRGARIASGTMITTLDDIQPIKLDFAVPERFLSALEPGARIEARSAAWPDERFTGRVSQISSRVDPVSRAVTIRAELPNESRQLRPGMLLMVDLVRDEREGLMVPEAALSPRGDDQYVFRVSDDQVEEVAVRIGVRRPGVVEIRSGLSAGDDVVVEGGMRLRPGREVAVQGRVDARELLEEPETMSVEPESAE